ncbi:MAG TPA: hypothetical protein VLC48_03310, partial [Gemmatimonadota bacterium]|nr:hypothetical protein [Gemmatimonadota bacterium]
MNGRALDQWKAAGVIASAAIVLTLPVYAVKESMSRQARGAAVAALPAFVGRESCIECHEAAYEAWLGSDHDNAMAVASDST